MYVVNAGPGFKKVLWPAAQKFRDPKTIAKIQVMDIQSVKQSLFCFFKLLQLQLFKLCSLHLQILDPKSLGKLLEVIDPRFVRLL